MPQRISPLLWKRFGLPALFLFNAKTAGSLEEMFPESPLMIREVYR